jgi:uncharacterized coiled-coil protein SlyX
LLPFLQQIVNRLGLPGTPVIFGRNSFGNLRYFVYLRFAHDLPRLDYSQPVTAYFSVDCEALIMRMNWSSVNHHCMVYWLLFLLNWSDLSKVARVTDSSQSRLDRMEMLYSELDHTIQALNDTISQQDREITRLNLNLEQLRLQIKSLQSEHSADIDSGFEPPPHY